MEVSFPGIDVWMLIPESRTLSNGSGLSPSFSSVSFVPNPLPGVSISLIHTITSLLSVVEHGREAEAEAAVRRLQSPSDEFNIPTPQETVALLSQTNAYERQITEGVGYLECFRGVNLRRTEITVGTWVAQQCAGPVLMTYAIYFFQQAGLAADQAFNMTLGLVSCLRMTEDRADNSTPSLLSVPSSLGR